MKYKVVAAMTLPELENLVNGLLGQGWELRGDLIVQTIGFVMSFMQVMVARP